MTIPLKKKKIQKKKKEEEDTEEDTDYTNLHHINISYTEPTGNPEKY